MSRRRNKKAKLNNASVQPVDVNSWSQAELILDMLMKCNTNCSSGFQLQKHKNEFEHIGWMVKNLPTLPYVMDSYLNFVFSNKLTTGDPILDERVLNPF